MDTEGLERLAIQRGCDYYSQGDPPPVPAVSEQQFSNEELAIALLNPALRSRAQTLRLYRAWLHLHAMDFAGVLAICEAVLPLFGEPAWSAWRRFCLVLAGTAGHRVGTRGACLALLEDRAGGHGAPEGDP